MLTDKADDAVVRQRAHTEPARVPSAALERIIIRSPQEHGPTLRAGRAQALDRVDDSLAGPILLACVECGELLEVAADVELLALAGLQRHALEVEHEIHLLAGAYGWSLDAIEALPDERRRRLAQLVADRR